LDYKNTFTQIFNFDISNSINTTSQELGFYIKTELGMRDFSIKPNILSLKGRTNINNVQKIIVKYIKEEKLCACCGGINTQKTKIMNVKKLLCLDC
jgi:translation initiation factor 2 beta subunit (eIF-2beta)/eIF-5